MAIIPTLESPSLYSTLVTTIYNSANLLEFLVYIPTIPSTLFCAFLIHATSILHHNLKCILLAQAAYVLLFAFIRIYALAGQFLSGNPFLIQPNWTYFAIYFAIVFGNLAGHFLMIERILATIFYKHYELYRQWDFTLVWLVSASVLSFVNSYYQVVVLGSMVNASDVTFWTHIVAMFASFAEIFIISLITYLNVNKFKLERNPQNVHALTVRYQLMENIRTGKQLGPTFLCHFIGVFLSFLVILNVKFKWMMDIDSMLIWIAIVFLLHAVNNFFLCTTAIIFHPILNRNARKLLRNVPKYVCPMKIVPAGGNNKVMPSGGTVDLDICPLPVDANGNIILGPGTTTPQLRNHTETYFRQLYTSWGDR